MLSAFQCPTIGLVVSTYWPAATTVPWPRPLLPFAAAPRLIASPGEPPLPACPDIPLPPLRKPLDCVEKPRCVCGKAGGSHDEGQNQTHSQDCTEGQAEAPTQAREYRRPTLHSALEVQRGSLPERFLTLGIRPATITACLHDVSH